MDFAKGEPPGLFKDVYRRIWSLKQPVEYDKFAPVPPEKRHVLWRLLVLQRKETSKEMA
ncbi:hypothetical protein FQN53_008583, partial [Emmonsiellopsis sp. PD_33]